MSMSLKPLSMQSKRVPLTSEIDIEMGLARPDLASFQTDSSRKNVKMRILRIDGDGKMSMVELKRADILKLAQVAAGVHSPHEQKKMSPRKSRANVLAGGFYHAVPALHARDLRKLDAAFASTNEPCVIVRKQAVVVSTDPIRAIILRDACFIFMSNQSEEFMPIFKAKLQKLVADKETESTAFEFSAIEAVLYTMCKLLATECEKTFPRIMDTLERLAQSQISSAELETLRALKNTINDFDSQVEGLRRVLMQLLDNDSDLRLLYLTHLFEDPELLSRPTLFEPEEAEALLECYLQEIHTVRTKIRLLQQRIHNTESLVMLKLDSTRNHLLAVDVLFGLVTVSLTFGMFVTAAFGMNLRTGLEAHNTAFSLVLVGSCIVCALIVVAGLLYFRKKGVLSLG